jgi:osmotically-inducible protein OsmY
VTLLGSVARGDDLQAVVDLVSQLPGVVDVESKVAVRPRPEARAAAGGRRR